MLQASDRQKPFVLQWKDHCENRSDQVTEPPESRFLQMLLAANLALTGLVVALSCRPLSPRVHASSSLELISGPGFVQRVLTFSPSCGQPQSPGSKTNRSQTALANSIATGEADKRLRASDRRLWPQSNRHTQPDSQGKIHPVNNAFPFHWD